MRDSLFYLDNLLYSIIPLQEISIFWLRAPSISHVNERSLKATLFGVNLA